jgi:hypothetical protein
MISTSIKVPFFTNANLCCCTKSLWMKHANELDSKLELAHECNLVPRNVTYQLLKLNAYNVIGCDPSWRDHNLLMEVHSLFEFF